MYLLSHLLKWSPLLSFPLFLKWDQVAMSILVTQLIWLSEKQRKYFYQKRCVQICHICSLYVTTLTHNKNIILYNKNTLVPQLSTFMPYSALCFTVPLKLIIVHLWSKINVIIAALSCEEKSLWVQYHNKKAAYV